MRTQSDPSRAHHRESDRISPSVVTLVAHLTTIKTQLTRPQLQAAELLDAAALFFLPIAASPHRTITHKLPPKRNLWKKCDVTNSRPFPDMIGATRSGPHFWITTHRCCRRDTSGLGGEPIFLNLPSGRAGTERLAGESRT